MAVVVVVVVVVLGREQATTYLALVIGAVRRGFQGALKSTLVVASSQQLPYLLGGVLDVGGRYGLDSRCERAKVKVGGAVRVQGIDVDGPPVDVGHAGGCAMSVGGLSEGGGVRAGGCEGVAECRGA